MNDISTAIALIKNYYTSNNYELPRNVPDYIRNYPPGYSRQVLKSKYNKTASQVVSLLNDGYSKPLSARERVLVEAERLRYSVVSDLSDISNSRSKVVLVCMDCGHEHTTTITSMQGTLKGCPACKSGNLPWHKRKEELVQIIKDRLDSSLISEVPSNQMGYVTMRHVCGTEYTTQLLGVVSPNSTHRATCPNCRSTDRRVVVDNITFGSEFESECYLILRHKNPEIHIPYSKYLPTTRKWVCDFKVGNYWIEVSNFKQDFKGYFSNIEDKRNVVENSEFVFLFVTSLKELEELVSLM